ncbi:hypothetical protein Sbal223_1921 [Shewanella baltica OS223]|uniref:hypothetical protein n=1 Tax=Shewanella baltica TaxID=62322 RepID=UPI0001883E18|nr:hypothetical protein [Shewanella baltica]ACK46426.1 hypothetical protein Sbal223_1921 [Shewanella baltica OS223]
MRHPLLNLVTQFTPGSMRLSTVMEVTVRDRDVTVEHTRMYLLRVTGMTVLNQTPSNNLKSRSSLKGIGQQIIPFIDH